MTREKQHFILNPNKRMEYGQIGRNSKSNDLPFRLMCPERRLRLVVVVFALLVVVGKYLAFGGEFVCFGWVVHHNIALRWF